MNFSTVEKNLKNRGYVVTGFETPSEAVKEVDTVVMGWNTYNQIVTELSPDKWIYNELTTYVITHRECISSERIDFVDTDPVDLVKRLRVEKGKGIKLKLLKTQCYDGIIDLIYVRR